MEAALVRNPPCECSPSNQWVMAATDVKGEYRIPVFHRRNLGMVTILRGGLVVALLQGIPVGKALVFYRVAIQVACSSAPCCR